MLSDSIRNDFPFFKNDEHPIAYFDNAATTQKPASVIEAIYDGYVHHNFNVHRSVYMAAQETTDKYEAVRQQVAQFINAPSANSIVFTKGTTDAINLVANGYFKQQIEPGDEIVVAISEHHSNLLPWMQLAKTKGASLKYIELDADGRLDLNQAEQIIDEHTRLVAVAAVSNVLGTINPIDQLSELAHNHHAELLVDAAQAVPEMPIDVLHWAADWVVFSGHKMLGPTGIGVLYGRDDHLKRLVPNQLGGEMVDAVSRENFTLQPLPWRLEAGTPNIIGVLGLGAAIEYLEYIGMDSIQQTCKQIGQQLADQLRAIDGITVYGPEQRDTGIIAFNLDNVHSHDVASALDLKQIAVRAGYHCAEPLMNELKTNGTVRISAYFYNSAADMERLINAIKTTKEFFKSNAN